MWNGDSQEERMAQKVAQFCHAAVSLNRMTYFYVTNFASLASYNQVVHPDC